MPRAKTTKPATEAAKPAVEVKPVPVATFNEADRDQYGGDEALKESRRKADGTFAPRQRPINGGDFDLLEGDIIYAVEPAKKIHVSPVYVDKTMHWSASDITGRLQDGYRFCLWQDFSIRKDKQFMWNKNTAGYISHLGADDKCLVLMWIPWDEYLRNQKKQTRESDNIQKSMSERLQEAAINVAREHSGPYRYETPTVDMATTKEERFVPDRE